MSDKKQEANPGWAAAQIAKASKVTVDKRKTAEEERVQADKKIALSGKWQNLFDTILTGESKIGTRKPTDAPEWVTLEVLAGGFASGNFKAALVAGDAPNESWTTPDGFARLDAMLESGKYRIEFPEHGALLAVAWLLEHGMEDAGRRVLAAITPWFGVLRFYPVPAETPVVVSPRVSVCSAGEVAESLRRLSEVAGNPLVPRIRTLMAQREAITKWCPLEADLVGLWAETIACPHPPVPGHAAAATATGAHCDDGLGKDSPCGWPCQRYPPGWNDRASALLARYRELQAEQSGRAAKWRETYSQVTDEFLLNRRHTRAGSSLYTMLDALSACVLRGPKEISGLTVSRIRLAIAAFNAKHGLVGSDRYAVHRQRVVASLATNTAEIAEELLKRLAGADPAEGLDDTGRILAPVALSGGAAMNVPKSLSEKVCRARVGTIQELLAAELIPSGEVLATLVPKLMAQAASMGAADESVRRLLFALTVSFARRRSLMLFNLEHQVTIRELPWAAAIQAACGTSEQQAAKDTLEVIVTETIRAFPQTIIPNKLLQAITELVGQAKLEIPVVEELASDIFFGAFGPKFLKAARIAARVMAGSFYERYYGLEPVYREILAPAMNDARFAQLCTRLAGVEGGRRGGSPADNGKILEREMIATTHNLATLVDGLHLQDRIDWTTAAIKAWAWILVTMTRIPTGKDDWRIRLQIVKDIAYAWRQLLFYFSMSPAKEAIVTEMRSMFSQSKASPFHRNLAKLLLCFDPTAKPTPPTLFGWVTGQHWLLAKK